MPKSLDKALTRPGRFDKKITLPFPSQKERENLFEYYMAKVQGLDPGLSVSSLARMMVRKTGADIKNLVNQAGIVSVSRGSPEVQMKGGSQGDFYTTGLVGIRGITVLRGLCIRLENGKSP